jgi:choline dehydrogenase-like flavoprotein
MEEGRETNTSSNEYDVVIVGGGPAGCSAGVFTARYGLNTIIFDRGRSSIQRCAHLENYLGFPAGIDIDTLYGLMHDHAEITGCELVPELVEAVHREGDEGGFVIETQEGRTVTTRRVVAAARYGGEYLRPLDDETMFETDEYDGEEHERFDREYPDHDGRTPIDGLYVAAPAGDAEAQAIISAGQGARVARTLLADVRRDRGYPDEVADHWDWVRREAELEDEWADRERWREWFAQRIPNDCSFDDDQLVELREAEIDRRLATYISTEEIEERTARGHRRLAERLDDQFLLNVLDETQMLDSMDYERIREYLDDETHPPQ